MVNQKRMSEVLSEFARTMITDFPIQRILDNLVDRIVEVLPITSAGVTLISAGSTPHYIAASDESARRFERLQTEIEEGPCLHAFETGEPVALPDLDLDRRFPRFSPAGVEAGLAAVFTFPLFHGKERFGALDLYRATTGDLDQADMAAAQTLADVAAALLLNAKAREDALATSDRFHHDSMHDALTGLPNRMLLQERLEHAALRARRAHTHTAVLFLDLDGFKAVNDTHGHLIGDELLRSVASRLLPLIRSGDTLARLSGDEFVLLCEELTGPPDVSNMVERINAAFERPFHCEGVELNVRTSIGTAYVGAGEAVTSDLLKRADLDMYRAKREEATAGILKASRTGVAAAGLEGDLRRAVEDGLLELEYQPIARLSDGSLCGLEALLRWTDPERGALPALLVVSIAERTELICAIGAWVLERACGDRARWCDAGAPSGLDVSVNVSVRQLMQPDFCSMVDEILTRTGVDPGTLVLELTESIEVEHGEQIEQVFAWLTERGVRLALDDFGTGYSALSYLSRIPIQIVKIDRGFVAELDKPEGRVVVAGITQMAHELGLVVVAEGVETALQRQQAIAAGCDFAQGFYFARPMSTDDILLLLTSDE